MNWCYKSRPTFITIDAVSETNTETRNKTEKRRGCSHIDFEREWVKALHKYVMVE